jgi:hypothetical protein
MEDIISSGEIYQHKSGENAHQGKNISAILS